MTLKTKSIFDPNKVNAVDGVRGWTDDHYKKAIWKTALINKF